jgi:hypothetical protein
MNTPNSKTKKKTNKNPLYAVNKKHNFVEEAASYFDLLLKKYQLKNFIKFLQQLVEIVLPLLPTYPLIRLINEMLDAVLSRFKLFTKFGVA